jgi:hypothetical protein
MVTRKPHSPRKVIAAATLGGAVALGSLGIACNRPGEEVEGPSSTATAPDIKQAQWRFDVRPSAVLVKRLRKRDQKRLMKQRGPLKKTVKDLYDALFLDPSSARRIIARRFVGNASRAFLRTNVGVGSSDTQVKTLKRTASIGIDATSGRRAAARVFIRARALIDAKKVKVSHRSTLWLERVRGRWVAIGFQVKQEPFA